MGSMTVGDHLIKKAQAKINEFIWSSKPANVAHRTLVDDYDRAGIRSPDFVTMKNSLRLARLSRLLERKTCNALIQKRL